MSSGVQILFGKLKKQDTVKRIILLVFLPSLIVFVCVYSHYAPRRGNKEIKIEVKTKKHENRKSVIQ